MNQTIGEIVERAYEANLKLEGVQKHKDLQEHMKIIYNRHVQEVQKIQEESEDA